MTEIILKPCPFCGGEADMRDDRDQTYRVGAFGECRNVWPTYYQAYCKSCGATGPASKVEEGCRMNTWWQREAEEKAAKAWNRRTIHDCTH